MELSEPATAIALLFPIPTLEKVKNYTDVNDLETWWLSKEWQEKIKEVAGGKTLVYGSIKDQVKAVNGLGKNTVKKERALREAAYGVSAALAIRSWMATDHMDHTNPKKVYLTGDKWPEDIEKFRLTYGGMKDYNSSDLVVGTGMGHGKGGDYSDYFYGVSLKKKETITAGDPTLINRSITDALNEVNESSKPARVKVKVGKKKMTIPSANPTSAAAAKFVKILTDIKWKFFARIIRDQDPRTGRVFQPRHAIGLGDPVSNPFQQLVFEYEEVDIFDIPDYIWNDDEELCRYKFPGAGKTGRTSSSRWGGDKPLIDYKGGSGQTGPVRVYVNDRIASDKNIYFDKIKDALDMTSTSPVKSISGREWKKVKIELAEELMDIILKISLNAEMDAKKLKGYYFGFSLCKAIAKVTEHSVTIHTGHIHSMQSILTALEKLNTGSVSDITTGYRFKLDHATQDKSGAAKIFMKMVKKKTTILDMELRYGGSFPPAPQFQAVISPTFARTYLKGINEEMRPE